VNSKLEHSQLESSDLKRAFAEDGPLKTHIGGQALIEGVMMRGHYNWAVGVREPEGSIYTEEHDLASGRSSLSWTHWPLVRGCRAFVESLGIGYKALEIAAQHAFGDEEDETEDTAASVSSSESLTHMHLETSLAATQETMASGYADTRTDTSFSWKRDFGNPDTMIDALGAQRSLTVVSDAAVSYQEDTAQETEAPAIVSEVHTEQALTERDTQPEPPLQRNEELVSQPTDSASQESKKGGGLTSFETMLSIVLGTILGLALFIVAPACITNLIVGDYASATLTWNIVDGFLRVAVFIFYIWLIGRMKDIKRMFEYHGAEHKTIHCFEHGLELTPENARTFPRLHVRCGTAFLIMVMIIAIIVYTITPLNGIIAAWGIPEGWPTLSLVIIVRILLLPVIAGLSYEITVRWAGSHPENPLVKVVLWPGMQMQYLTTREPDDGELECAIAAMKLVIAREERELCKVREP
jgi:uncharacterized protein YqhQ